MGRKDWLIIMWMLLWANQYLPGLSIIALCCSIWVLRLTFKEWRAMKWVMNTDNTLSG